MKILCYDKPEKQFLFPILRGIILKRRKTDLVLSIISEIYNRICDHLRLCYRVQTYTRIFVSF